MSTTMDKMVTNFEITLLAVMGELENVKRAIDARDLAAVVRAGSKALNRSDLPAKLSRAAEPKSTEASNKYRQEGNDHYKKRAYKEAIVCYNKALGYAPNGSLEVALAYSNISAVLLAIKAYKACSSNIEAALKLDCPEYLKVKLKKRTKEIEEMTIGEMLYGLLLLDDNVLNYMQLDVERNPEIPCVSLDVTVHRKDVVAARDIKSGTLVALEQAYVSNQDKSAKYSSCYHCHKMTLFFIPCEGCSKALFCSIKCREKGMEEYHRIECCIMGHLYIDTSDINQELNKLAVKAAIRMSLKLGWEQLRVASLDIGKKRFQKSSVAEAFDRNNPTSLLCYDDQVGVRVDVMINKSLFCAAVLHLISKVPNYWPEDKKERRQAVDALSRTILHLNTTFSRKIPMSCSAVDHSRINDLKYPVPGAQCTEGWFSFASKLAHSCEPNLLAVGLNDHVALVALQTIKKGDQLTICYTDHFYDMNLVPSPKNTLIRQQIILSEIKYLCKCRVCLLEWESKSHVQGTLAGRQQAAYVRCKAAMDIKNGFKRRMKALGAALDELTGCVNTTQHRSVYHDLRATLNICQNMAVLNECYGRME